MAQPAPKLPTFEELYARIEALPDGVHGEILGPSEMRAMSRPARPHAFASRVELRALRRFDRLEGGAGWWFEIEAEIRFPDGRLYVPDISGWRWEEDDPPDFIYDNPIEVLPDWTCEILSRRTQRGDRAVKLPVYAAAGVGHVCVIDLTAHTVEVYASRNGQPVLVATARGDDVRELPPFPGTFEAGKLWLPERKKPGPAPG